MDELSDRTTSEDWEALGMAARRTNDALKSGRAEARPVREETTEEAVLVPAIAETSEAPERE